MDDEVSTTSETNERPSILPVLEIELRSGDMGVEQILWIEHNAPGVALSDIDAEGTYCCASLISSGIMIIDL